MFDEQDWWIILKLIYYLNDSNLPKRWERSLILKGCSLFERPEEWPEHDPQIYILAYCIHDDHIHFLVKEIRQGGITAFMRRLPNSFSNKHRVKYEKSGNIFQPAYTVRWISSEADLHNVALYIMAKNTMERYPEEGITGALRNFTKASKWANNDPFSSFADYGSTRNSPILKKEILEDRFSNQKLFLSEAKGYLKNLKQKEEDLGSLAIDE